MYVVVAHILYVFNGDSDFCDSSIIKSSIVSEQQIHHISLICDPVFIYLLSLLLTFEASIPYIIIPCSRLESPLNLNKVTTAKFQWKEVFHMLSFIGSLIIVNWKGYNKWSN